MPAKPTFKSEELEPTMGLVMGRLYARVQWEMEHGDRFSVARECEVMWYGAQAIEKMAVTCGGDRGATHFSIAASNNVSMCADLIESITGVRPEENA